jgi:hypothetical protein
MRVYELSRTGSPAASSFRVRSCYGRPMQVSMQPRSPRSTRSASRWLALESTPTEYFSRCGAPADRHTAGNHQPAPSGHFGKHGVFTSEGHPLCPGTVCPPAAVLGPAAGRRIDL